MAEQPTVIEKIPLFSGLDRKGKEAVARAFKEASFPAGVPILKDSDREPGFYVLLEGTAEVRRSGAVIASLKPYEFFGELLALGYQSQRTADVVAVDDCKCLVAGHHDFSALLSSNRLVAMKILEHIKDRYRSEGGGA